MHAFLRLVWRQLVARGASVYHSSTVGIDRTARAAAVVIAVGFCSRGSTGWPRF
jgi:hypothetical protein